jgi:radical SAM superfamily enzyme YgiQ (UPF0313 family)
MLFDIKYSEPLFRPPSEAYSAILQATIGCSWNKCAFCEMYTSKKFKVRPFDEIRAHIDALSKVYQGVRKVFIADGNAFALSTSRLVPILHEINLKFERLQRISSYALPKDIISKTDDELKELQSLGLKLLYIGIETGDEELLNLINKGETPESTVQGIVKAQKAGIDTSVMIINGLGGRLYSQQHAINSAKVVNQINPRFLSTLTLSMPYGIEHYKSRFNGNFEPLSLKELLEELRLFFTYLEVNDVIFRSDHVSNNLVLKGVFPKDKNQFIEIIDGLIAKINR